jgi:hypothetical protein
LYSIRCPTKVLEQSIVTAATAAAATVPDPVTLVAPTVAAVSLMLE